MLQFCLSMSCMTLCCYWTVKGQNSPNIRVQFFIAKFEFIHLSLLTLFAEIEILCVASFIIPIFRSSRPEMFLRKRCSENMQQIYWPKCDFNKVALDEVFSC